MTSRRAAPLLAFVLVLFAFPAGAAASKPCGGAEPTITGSPRSERIVGTERDDVIRAGRGNDVVDGLGGDDTICAGPDDDALAGGAGDDKLREGDGADRADGGDGDDRIHGQGGDDRADGEGGVDGCLVEHHEECEADLTVSATGPLPITAGDQKVTVGVLELHNLGPTQADRTVGAGTLPPEAEFVASRSDPRCVELVTDEVRCSAPPIPAGDRVSMDVAFRFPNCPRPNQQVTFKAAAEDSLTTDPVPRNNSYSISASLTPAPSCP